MGGRRGGIVVEHESLLSIDDASVDEGAPLRGDGEAWLREEEGSPGYSPGPTGDVKEELLRVERVPGKPLRSWFRRWEKSEKPALRVVDDEEAAAGGEAGASAAVVDANAAASTPRAGVAGAEAKEEAAKTPIAPESVAM